MPFEKQQQGIGNLYSKPDMERVGLFLEMPFMNGQGYTPLFEKPAYLKGKNMLSGGVKLKTAVGDCYFDKECKRLFIGEGRGRKIFGQRPTREAGFFLPSGNPKKHASPGDYYGCFGGKLEAFSNAKKPKPPFKREPRNAISSPSKKGTGYGYANVALNKYPEHMAYRHDVKPKYKEYGKQLGRALVPIHWPQPYFDKNPFKEPGNIKPGPTYVRPKNIHNKISRPFMPTGPAKWPGGSHAGCFDKYPEYKANKYITIADLDKPRKIKGPTWYTHTYGDITYRTTSLLTHNIKFKVNQTNFSTAEPSFVNYLVKDKVNIII